MTTNMMFERIISSTSSHGGPNCSRPYIEDLDRAYNIAKCISWKSSLGFCGFEKVTLLGEISEILESLENLKKSRESLLLYELFEREPG